jgi:hypothetical protein
MAARNISLVSSKEVLKFISDLGISKITLRQEDIESILDTLIYDGKVSCSGLELWFSRGWLLTTFIPIFVILLELYSRNISFFITFDMHLK